MKILIADDSDEVRRSLTRLLSTESDIEIVGEAVDAHQAIEKTKTLKPDILILDLKMPKGSGLDVLNELRDFRKNLSVIILTNYTSHQFREESLKAGVDFFFDKSTEFEKILEAIQETRVNRESK